MGVTVRRWSVDADAVSSRSHSRAYEHELRHTISLIRGTSHRLSLFCVRAAKIESSQLAEIVRSQFDREAQVGIAETESGEAMVWLMFIRTGGGDRVLEARVQAILHAALSEADCGCENPRIHAVHRDARTTSDFDDLIYELRASRTETPAGIFH
jgi:hypothetical protein